LPPPRPTLFPYTTLFRSSAVAAAITPTRLEQVVRILERDLREKFGIARPSILVCGLNPHAGESGHLGREEIDVIAPTLETLRRRSEEHTSELQSRENLVC